MAGQQFCLRWNNHQNNLLDVFGNLLSNENFVDVTLACDGKQLKAHKMVLSACSSFFQEIFLNNPCKHPVVFIKDVKYSELNAIVEFMYRGEVNISQDQLSSLLKTAESLKVKGLAEVSGAEQQSQDAPSSSSTSVPISNNNNNDNITQQPKTTSQASYPPSPKRQRTRRFESRHQEPNQHKVQTYPQQSPAPSQPENIVNEPIPPQEIDLEEDVKPILIKESPKYAAEESNSNDFDMYSSFIEQSFDDPGGENYDTTEQPNQSLNNTSEPYFNNMDLEQAPSSSSSTPMQPTAGNSSVSRAKLEHKKKSTRKHSSSSRKKKSKSDGDYLAKKRERNAVKQRKWRAMIKLDEEKYRQMKEKDRERKKRARLNSKVSDKDRFSPEIFKVLERYNCKKVEGTVESKRLSSSSSSEEEAINILPH